MPESSSEDGNDSSPDSPLSPPVPPVGGFREETISKEKQKFFRLNSFYGIKGRGPSRCKAEGRPVRDISCSSNSSESSVENDLKKPKQLVQPALRNTDNNAIQSKAPLSTTHCNGKQRSDGKRKAGDEAIKENAEAPFSLFGASVPCITFEDLAKRSRTSGNVAQCTKELPAPKANVASWLEKPKSCDANDCSAKNNFSRIFPNAKPLLEGAIKSADVKCTVTSKSREPSSSDSWHTNSIIKPSSSIVSQKPPDSKSPEVPPPAERSVRNADADEELWGFAAMAARKEVTPVLHLDKEGAPSYPSYNVFVSGVWSKDKPRLTAEKGRDDAPNKATGGVTSGRDESPKREDKVSLSLSPSKLVKSAVLSKQYEHVRRNMLSSNTPFLFVNQSGDIVTSDKETIKKNLIAEATKTQHFQVCRHLNHLSVQSVSVPPSRPYNQSGKRITSYLKQKYTFRVS